jgi:hypothetical protein
MNHQLIKNVLATLKPIYVSCPLYNGFSPNKMQGDLKCEMLVEWAFCYFLKNLHDNC